MNVKEFAEKLMVAESEAWQKGNYDKLEELEDSGVIYHQDPELIGLEAHKQYILTARQAFPVINQDWKFITGDENIIVLSVDGNGVLMTPPQGTSPAEEKDVNIGALMVFRLENEKIVEVWGKHTMTFLDQ